MYVCVCNKVTDSKINHAIDGGADSIKALREALGVGTSCGVCIGLVSEMLMEKDSGRANVVDENVFGVA